MASHAVSCLVLITARCMVTQDGDCSGSEVIGLGDRVRGAGRGAVHTRGSRCRPGGYIILGFGEVRR
jgi:hypothetical protein